MPSVVDKKSATYVLEQLHKNRQRKSPLERDVKMLRNFIFLTKGAFSTVCSKWGGSVFTVVGELTKIW